jgi:hypothetical protein
MPRKTGKRNQALMELCHIDQDMICQVHILNGDKIESRSHYRRPHKNNKQIAKATWQMSEAQATNDQRAWPSLIA